tara:strand:- start:29 stop:502 length:474 start_codon:yes stop_codon:yes gene_type:complete
MQEIIDLLNSMGLDQQGWSGQWQDIPNISGGQIGNALSEQFGFGDEYSEGLFQPISMQSMQGLLPSTYSPFMQAAQQPLLSDLISKSGGKKATAAAGGFAGSGGYDRFKGQAKDVYGKGMSETLSGIAQQRGTQQASIMDLINQWRETAAGLSTPNL